ncbi:hypothetical protein BC826DRAFT_1113059 [Russula brevipes]|nr:hypothetical protein BC826DRAFT_1113059 [Russula brevipes]
MTSVRGRQTRLHHLGPQTDALRARFLVRTGLPIYQARLPPPRLHTVHLVALPPRQPPTAYTILTAPLRLPNFPRCRLDLPIYQVGLPPHAPMPSLTASPPRQPPTAYTILTAPLCLHNFPCRRSGLPIYQAGLPPPCLHAEGQGNAIPLKTFIHEVLCPSTSLPRQPLMASPPHRICATSLAAESLHMSRPGAMPPCSCMVFASFTNVRMAYFNTAISELSIRKFLISSTKNKQKKASWQGRSGSVFKLFLWMMSIGIRFTYMCACGAWVIVP